MTSFANLNDLPTINIMYQMGYGDAYQLALTNKYYMELFEEIENELAYNDLYIRNYEEYDKNEDYIDEVQENYKNFYELKKAIGNKNLVYDRNIRYDFLTDVDTSFMNFGESVLLMDFLTDNVETFKKYVNYYLNKPYQKQRTRGDKLNLIKSLLQTEKIVEYPELYEAVIEIINERMPEKMIFFSSDINNGLTKFIRSIKDNSSDEYVEMVYRFFEYIIDNKIISKDRLRDLVGPIVYWRYPRGEEISDKAKMLLNDLLIKYLNHTIYDDDY